MHVRRCVCHMDARVRALVKQIAEAQSSARSKRRACGLSLTLLTRSALSRSLVSPGRLSGVLSVNVAAYKYLPASYCR